MCKIFQRARRSCTLAMLMAINTVLFPQPMWGQDKGFIKDEDLAENVSVITQISDSHADTKNKATNLSFMEKTALDSWCRSVFNNIDSDSAKSCAIVRDIVKRKDVNPVLHLLRALQIGLGADEDADIQNIINEEQKFIEGSASQRDRVKVAVDYVTSNVYSTSTRSKILLALVALSENKYGDFILYLNNAVKDQDASALYIFGRLYARGELAFPVKTDLGLRYISLSAKQGYLPARIALKDWDSFIAVSASHEEVKEDKKLIERLSPPY